MDLKFKPDWEETKQRYLAWWNHEYFGRCALSVTAPKSGPKEAPPVVPEKPEDKWLNYDYLKINNEYRMSNTFYGGEALPIWNPGYPNWTNLPVFLGADLKLTNTTGWTSPMSFKEDITEFNFRKLSISPDNPWWIRAKEMHQFAVSEAKGKSLPGLMNIAGTGDIMASIRSSERLLFDVADNPEYVKEFAEHITDIWIDVHDTFYKIVNEGAEGSAGWFQLWAPGRFYCLSCDFAYMISPTMFNEIFLPTTERLTHYLDYMIFHVDGIGSFAHAAALCELPKLQSIQILPGAGKPSPLHYIDTLKLVQAAGKNLHITIPSNEVEIALSELSARGLFIQTRCKTQEEAEYLLKMVERWSKDI